MKNKLLKIILCLICACVLTGCDVIKTVDNNIKETIKEVIKEKQ